jgi:hypothetical protein
MLENGELAALRGRDCGSSGARGVFAIEPELGVWGCVCFGLLEF